MPCLMAMSDIHLAAEPWRDVGDDAEPAVGLLATLPLAEQEVPVFFIFSNVLRARWL